MKSIFVLRNDILRFPGKKSADVFDGDFQQAKARSAGGPGQMRSNNTIFRLQQRMVGRGWFDRKDIQARARQSAGVQRLSQRLLVDQLPSAGVEQQGAR